MKVSAADRIAGIVAVLIGLLSLSEAWKLYAYRIALFNGDHVFPFIVGLGLVLFGMMLSIRGDRISQGTANDRSEVKVSHLIYVIPVVLLLYVALINWSGYLIATFIASIILFHLIGKFRWYWSIGGSLILTAALYFIFVEWLNTPLPSGSWL
ncbi:tripartite tricarboxylate transporter TctB family protein [Paenibacillus urinalis]|uniref:tripartite tricarboxylate transporter TctB family protein n=1 Tax=Paenibacillus urinalis TaxID=521520 RepID=UPI0019608E96